MTSPLAFTTPDLWSALAALDDAALDSLDFGVIGFTADGRICRYNQHETQATGLSRSRVLGSHVFDDIAQCMNNYLVALRFEDALANQQPLDTVIDYVLTWRMKPTPVALRLLMRPPAALHFLALQRRV
jgi:photoactive yellow protein